MDKFLEEGSRQYLKGNINKAIDCFLKVLELDPNNVKALFYLSIAYMDTSNYEKALNVLDKLLEIDSKHVQAYKNRALVKYSMNKEKEAMEDYKIYTKLANGK
jgi:tetratricopeptide (TPR) repeat protein